MSPHVSVGMIIRYASHNLRFIYSTNTKYFKECPKVSTGESRQKCVPTPMHKFTRSGEPRGAHEGGGRAQGGGRAPLPRGLLEASLTSAPRLLDHVRSKNHAPE